MYWRVKSSHGLSYITKNEEETEYSWIDDSYVVEANIQPTLMELAEFLDGEAENANRYHMVGTHAKLAALIKDKAGEVIALDILEEIAKHGGLHEWSN